jgi:CheY-like chemotaxis protein
MVACESSESPTHADLVVEDDRDIRQLFAEALRDEGYLVAEVRDGAEAIGMLAPNTPHVFCVMLLDMMLPRVDGQGVLAHLRQQGLSVPVVAMSASQRHLEAARAAGAQDTLPKPLELDQLLEAVVRNCGCQNLHGPVGQA